MSDFMNAGGINPRAISGLPHDTRANPRTRRNLAAVASLAFVVVAVWVVQVPALTARAICFDDDSYLLDNELVQHPGWHSVGRFFTEVTAPSTVRGYYHPVAMTSLMLDWAAGGRPPDLSQFHRTSLALHALNAGLLAFLLLLLFREPFSAAAAALLFGLHPTTIEAFTWVGERKTVLATFFALLCIVLFVGYARRRSLPLFVASLIAFVLALLSKPTAVPLPAILLLLDYWPLKRLSKEAWIEKAPFFAVAIASSIVTLVSQARTAKEFISGDSPALHAFFTMSHDVAFYIAHFFWPTRLSSYYPYPEPFAWTSPWVLSGIVLTLVLGVLLLLSLRRTRAAAASFLIFFVALLPTLGIVGFTGVIAADKYLYFPAFAIYLLIAFVLGSMWTRFANTAARATLVVALGGVAGAEAVASRAYLSDWSDTDRLFTRMIALTPQSSFLENAYATELVRQQRLDDALAHLRRAVTLWASVSEERRVRPEHIPRDRMLTEGLVRCGALSRRRPDNGDGHYCIGVLLSLKGDGEQAIHEFDLALRSDPRDSESRNRLARELDRQK